MYRSVGREQIAETLVHLRGLFRQALPSNAKELLAHERREAVTKNLLSNLRRTKEHPTLHTILEVADCFSLTLDGAHQLFGYDLEGLREYDARLNSARTHILESYRFRRDALVDVPFQLADRTLFSWDAQLRDLVSIWQTDVPVQSLDGESWKKLGTFYVHVGTQDSLGSGLPPGATALVEPIEEKEAKRPDPRAIYLLQFGNGYRCARCVVTNGRLLLLVSPRDYRGPQSFVYPGSVRIAGRVKTFALKLPQPRYPTLRSLPASQHGAPLLLPWEHGSMAQLFAAKHLRFRRSQDEHRLVREALEEVFGSLLSRRTERRYRRPTRSQPHIDSLLQLTLMNFSRYTDVLRASRLLFSDAGRFSLQTLLQAEHPVELSRSVRSVLSPIPKEIWDERRREFGEWPSLLSSQFPQLHSLQERIIRISSHNAMPDLTPPLTPGSLLVLSDLGAVPDPQSDALRAGWMRPIYALRRQAELFCGYLEGDGNQFVIRANSSEGRPRPVLNRADLLELHLVSGVAVAV